MLRGKVLDQVYMPTIAYPGKHLKDVYEQTEELLMGIEYRANLVILGD